MPEPRYRIDSLAVEGFKAFGDPQDIPLAGMHCFLFGPNARGKSSIVEAIRWCLFGLERDSDVRNRFREAVDCRVELRLRDASGLWRLERRLRPGQLRSDLTIRNPDGREVTQKEALPNLVRLGTSAGAVVFFSTQQATRARAYADLTRFHEVLYAHLDLVEAERLRNDLGQCLEEQLEIQRQRAESLQSTENKLQDQLKSVDASLEGILRNPPWELDEVPTRAMSGKRIRSFVSDMAADAGSRVEGDWEPHVALGRAETWVHDRSGERHAKREQSIASINTAIDRLSKQIADIKGAKARVEESIADTTDLNRQLAALCDGNRIDKLEACLKAASDGLNKEQQLALAYKAVVPLLGPDIETCPICGLGYNGLDLMNQVTERIQQTDSANKQAAERVQQLARQKEQAQNLASRRDAATRGAETAQAESAQLVAQVCRELGCPSHEWERSAEARLTELKGRVNDVQQEGRSAAEQKTKHLQRIKKLREEWRYHQLREEEQRLRRDLQEGLQPARDRLRTLEDFRSTVAAVYKALCEEFDAAVDRALPTVSAQLTEAFRRLTDHPAFDVLRVERAEGPDKMMVRVGSTRASVPWSRPEDVLNGGAFAALGLIPHLVFSGFHAEQAELNVLIVDDPSQSFDTSHVRMLLEELRLASEHAQLLLATHEEERFLPIVRELFSTDTFTVIRVTDFRPDGGPTIAHG